jgi:hypothetical protein
MWALLRKQAHHLLFKQLQLLPSYDVEADDHFVDSIRELLEV